MREHKQYQPLLWLMALLAFVMVLFVGTGAQASQINKNPFVDTIVVDKSEAYAGEVVNMKISFSEKAGNKFAPGDEMVFDLPKELEGFQTSMQLEDYAVVTVDGGRAVVKFTDKVSVKDHIKGKLSFNLKVTDTLAKDSENTLPLNFGTNINTSLKVKGHKSSTGTGEQTRHKPAYKGGYVDTKDPTILNWYIVVNANMDNIFGDVNVTDALGKGHVYIADSFKITGNPNMPAPQVKIGADKHFGDKFSVTLPEKFVSGTSVGITYQTRLDKDGMKMKELTNKFSASFANGHNNPQSIFDGAKLANLLMTGEIEGDEEVKHETEGTIDPMPEETVDEILPIVPDKGNESTEDNHLEDGIHGSGEDVHNFPKEEELPADEQVDEIAPIEPEKGNESIEGSHTEDGIHGSRPEVHIDETEEVIPEEEIETIDPITPENIDGKVVEDDLVDPIKPKDQDKIVDPKPEQPKEEEVKPEEVEDPKKPEEKKAEKKDSTKKADKKTEKKAETKNVEAKKSVNKSEAKKSAELPNTGSVDNIALTIAGVLGLVFAGFVMIRRGK